MCKSNGTVGQLGAYYVNTSDITKAHTFENCKLISLLIIFLQLLDLYDLVLDFRVFPSLSTWKVSDHQHHFWVRSKMKRSVRHVNSHSLFLWASAKGVCGTVLVVNKENGGVFIIILFAFLWAVKELPRTGVSGTQNVFRFRYLTSQEVCLLMKQLFKALVFSISSVQLSLSYSVTQFFFNPLKCR